MPPGVSEILTLVSEASGKGRRKSDENEHEHEHETRFLEWLTAKFKVD
jgi:hypothetical protein